MTDQKVEHRLTRIETKLDNVLSRLDFQNGRIVNHFIADEEWQNKHDLTAAHAMGFRAGMLLVMGVVVAIASTAASVIGVIIGQALK